MTVLMVILALVSVILIVSVMFQKGNSNGLSAVSGGSDSAYGAKKKASGNDAKLSKITIASAVVFVVLNLVILIIG